MLAIQGLKKQLRGIRSTMKLTKAMRTVSTVKFSKLSVNFYEYSKYGRECRRICEQYGQFFSQSLPVANPKAPSLVVVMTSNKGLCGNFNAEILKFAEEEFAKMDSFLLAACGKKAIQYYKSKGIPVEKEYILKDSPTYEESNVILDDIIAWRKEGKISQVYIIYPKYVNIMSQSPEIRELFLGENANKEDFILFVPNQDTVNQNLAQVVFRAMFYEFVLETAVGAQAATLMTMRSAYDTATEYYEELEGEINRMRQSMVTSDVIETSVERKEE